MRTKTRWLAMLVAALGLGTTGCQTWFGGMTLPSGRYLQHYPQYFSPDPQHPLPRELASQEDPTAPRGWWFLPPSLRSPANPVPLDGGR